MWRDSSVIPGGQQDPLFVSCNWQKYLNIDDGMRSNNICGANRNICFLSFSLISGPNSYSKVILLQRAEL